MGYRQYIRRMIVQFASFFYASRSSKVIFYHDLHVDHLNTDMSTHIDLFRRHIQIIRDFDYEIVPEITQEKGQVQICFDDGFSGIHHHLDVIKELDVYIKLFVVTDNIDQIGYLNRVQLIDLSLNKNINIQSHTHTHRRLSCLSKEDLIWELKTSKSILEEIISCNVDSLCFPEGRYSNNVINIALECGYNSLYSSLPGFYHQFNINKIINRSLVQHSEESEFRSILKGGDNLLYYWYKLKHKSI